MSKTIHEIYEETKTNYKFNDFQVNMPVQVMTPCVDFTFFYGEAGKVIKNSGEYLGITVEFDKPRKYEDGYIQKTFNFNPCDLKPLKEKEEIIVNENPCLCHYPCKTENCPKEKDAACHVNHCEVVQKYSVLTYDKKYCSECGRKIK